MRNFLIKNENVLNLDEIDRKIILFLQKNGRMADSEMARKLDVSNDTVKRRRERLEKEGIIRIKAVLDPKKFGYIYYIHAGISTKPQASANKLVEKLMQVKGVYYIAISLGPSHNILAHYRGRKREDLYEFVEWLRKQDEVESLDINTIYDVVKSGYRDVPLDELL